MKNVAIPLFLMFCSAIASAQDRPIPAKDAPKRMTVPEGFNVTLFAGEPDVVQPIAISFDDRGRLWVVECLSYPKWTADGTGQDRVTLYEDTDGDGVFDRKQIIFDKGSNLSGIQLGHGGIWLCSLPNLVFLPCDFNADKPKLGKMEIVLDGWGMKCKHNVFNSLTWGPDGWLYGCNGILDTAYVGKPGADAKHRTAMNCGVWRYHPAQQKFEVVAHGTTNPFGLDFDERGEMFITNCVIHHLWHVVPGAHFERMYGQDLIPNTYALMPSCADHIHWGGGDWTTSRGGKGTHSEAGGGHAHVGCMVYLGDNWPESYRNGVFTLNLHGNRINHDRLERQRSGYVAKHEKDPLLANDPWFRGIAIQYGPDGGVYMTDWTDTGECHNYDKVDLTNGRIYKVAYQKCKPWSGDLSKMTDKELIGLLNNRNAWQARHAQRLLEERARTKNLTADAVRELKALVKADDSKNRLTALWVLHASGLLQEGDYRLAFNDTDETVRGWAVRLSGESAPNRQLFQAEYCSLAKTEKSAYVRLQLASIMRHLSIQERRNLAEALAKHGEDADDPNIPLMIWYGMEPALTADTKATLPILEQVKIPLLREFIARRTIEINPDHFGVLLALAAKSQDVAIQRDILAGIQAAFGGWREIPARAGWQEYSVPLLKSPSKEVRERTALLGVMFGDKALIKQLKTTLADLKAPNIDRVVALRALVQRGKNDIVPILKELLKEADFRPMAIRALAAFKDDETPTILLKAYRNYSPTEREDVVQTLAARPAWALGLLEAIERGDVPRGDVSVFTARQMQGLKDSRVTERLTQVWGQIKPASQERIVLTKKYKELLKPDFIKQGDLSKGRSIFAKTCAACHRLYDDGGNIGPALTGAQRHNLDYVLENVIDPSAVVAKEYLMTKIETANGRFINGIVRQESEKAITLQTQNELLILPKSEIVSRELSKLSLMPDGLLEKMKDEEIRDLIAYLQSKDQVPLPK